MGWLFLLLLAGAVLAALWWLARPARRALQLIAVALLIAAAGYAWQGRPDLAGAAAPGSAVDKPRQRLFALERAEWLDRMGLDAQALDSADMLIRNGDPEYAIAVLRGAIGRRPQSAMLWIGLGNALATYADGVVTPAARFSYDHAAGLAPGDPAPGYFLGLAYAEMGDIDSAERILITQLALAPDGPRRLAIGQKLLTIARLRAAGALPR